ncbi:MAG: sigma-70 family RNA polymerase sigma factor [Verrucomicrobiota bacterium]
MAASDPHFTEFVRNGSEEAFQRLVARHMDMVHSTAGRLLGDRRDAAADVAQTVFTQLARRAALLPPDLLVSVWLHTQTRRAALNVIRGETRRAIRERTAADLLQMNAPDPDAARVNAALMPHIDGAIAELPRLEQQALILRFFEQCGLQEIGDRLGLSAGAVRQRLTRALEKLRGRLSRRGVVLSAAALTLWLSSESVKAAPASLLTASSLAAAALQSAGSGAGAASGSGAGGLFSTLTFMSGIKSILIGTALGLAGGGFWGTWMDPAPAASLALLSSRTTAPSLRPPGESGAAVAQRFAVPPPEDTAEGLLTQLLGMVSGPDNELTRQRLAVWLEAVPKELWSPLLELADRRLSADERSRWLPDLARQWGRVDPAAAIPGLAKRRGTDNMNGAGLAALGFGVWHGAEPDKALHWLMEQQDNPALVQALPRIISVVAESLAASSGDAAVRWAGQLQGDDLRKAALQPVWEKLDREGKEKRNGNENAWREACGKLLEEPDPVFRRLALAQALSAWTNGADSRAKGQRFGATEQWLGTLPPSPGKVMAAELLLGEAVRIGSGTPPATTIGALTAEGGEAAGEAAVRAVLQADKMGLNARGWLLPLLSGPEREAAIFRAARLTDFKNGEWTSMQPRQGEAILWAAELSDPAVRDPLVYGIFQRWLEFEQKDRIGGGGNYVAPWLEKSSLSPEIKSMLEAAAREFKAKGNP